MLGEIDKAEPDAPLFNWFSKKFLHHSSTTATILGAALGS